MAYPTGMLSITLEDVDRRALAVKTACQSARTASAAGNINGSDVIAMYNFLKAQRAGLAAASTVPGLGAYAQAQKNSPGLDVVVAFNDMLAAIDGVTTWITTNYPKDVNGFLLERTWGANGPVDRQFTSVQTVGYRTALDSLIATIA